MKHFFYTLVLFMAVLTIPAMAQTYQSAMTDLKITDNHTDRNLAGLLWYPTNDSGPMVNDFESKVWKGNKIVKDANHAPGRFPLVVLSHGMFGNSRNQAWLASALAKRGFIVAAIDHPGTSTWLRDADQRRQLWQRPRDISRVIDFATGSPQLSPRVDPKRIFVAGHSLGGFTIAALAGARYDAARLKRFCDATPGELTCNILNKWKIAKTPQDRVEMEADLSDPRIKGFILFDLGGTQSFSDESLRHIKRPMLIYGAPIMNSGLTLDIESRALVNALPPHNVRYIEPETLSHFDFLGQCKPGGFELLAKEEPGDEIICNNGSLKRARKHNMIIRTVTEFLSQP